MLLAELPCLTANPRLRPGATAAGITALIWYSPTNPGVRPANETCASLPPTVAVTGAFATIRLPLELTAPNPVPNATTVSPPPGGIRDAVDRTVGIQNSPLSRTDHEQCWRHILEHDGCHCRSVVGLHLKRGRSGSIVGRYLKVDLEREGGQNLGLHAVHL